MGSGRMGKEGRTTARLQDSRTARLKMQDAGNKIEGEKGGMGEGENGSKGEKQCNSLASGLPDRVTRMFVFRSLK